MPISAAGPSAQPRAVLSDRSMLRFLFGRLTDGPKRGQSLFERAVAEARKPHWFTQGEVPDTIDGRFAMLATTCALVIVRLESDPGSPEGDSASAALTERFIELSGTGGEVEGLEWLHTFSD